MGWRQLPPTRMESSRVTLLMASPRTLKEAMEEDLPAQTRPRLGWRGNNQLEHLDWVLLDENNHAFPLKPIFYNYI